MNPGKLDRRITFQQATQTRLSNGEAMDTWSDYATRWAAISYAKGSDIVEGERLLSTGTVKFTVRYDSRINKSMRIKYKHWFYNIVNNPVELGRQDYLLIDAETTDDEDLLCVDSILITADSTLYTSDQTRW
jgi:SPP1 family predicted phage head-tail adaptor